MLDTPVWPAHTRSSGTLAQRQGLAAMVAVAVVMLTEIVVSGWG